MSPTLNGSSAIWQFEGSDAIEIHDGITSYFYMGLPHVYIYQRKSAVQLTSVELAHTHPNYQNVKFHKPYPPLPKPHGHGECEILKNGFTTVTGGTQSAKQ